MSSLVIGISGKARAGKSTIAARLVERWGFTQVSFADVLKEEVLARLPLALRAIHDLSRHRNELSSCSWNDRPTCIRDMVFNVKPLGVRELLQEYGTGVRRADDPEYWVREWERTATATTGRIVAADVRFPNEAEAVVARGGLLWRVERDGLPMGNHESETALDGWRWWDHVIVNDGSVADLHARVDALMERIA